MAHISQYHYLIFSVLVLWLGPVIVSIFKKSHHVTDYLDGFVLLTITGLVTLHILPHTFHEIGWPAILLATFGFVLPGLFEKIRNIASQMHKVTVFITVLGICIHTFVDGFALSKTGDILPLAIVLHRIPVGILIWWLTKKPSSLKAALGALALMSVITVIGFISGSHYSANEHISFVFLEAFIAGSLLHVVFHEPHKVTHDHNWHWGSGLGALTGIVFLYLIQIVNKDSLISETSATFFSLAEQTATALFIAYIFSGVIQAFMGETPLRWLKKGSLLSQSTRGMIFGLPLPICSCGVVPVYRSLVKRGVPLSAGIAFFIATPEIGLDALLISFPLLGLELTLYRLACAAILALVVALLMGLFFKNKITKTDSSITKKKLSFKERVKLGIHTGLEESVDHTGPWILLGLFIAAICQPILADTTWLFNIPQHWQIPFFAILGMPIYVCASGITPFVAVLIFYGISPGAAIAFLLTGPATNTTSFGVLKELHGKKIAAAFVFFVISMAVSLGYLVNTISIETKKDLFSSHEHGANYQTVFLLLVAALYAVSLLRKGPRYLLNQIIAFDPLDKKPNQTKQDSSCC